MENYKLIKLCIILFLSSCTLNTPSPSNNRTVTSNVHNNNHEQTVANNSLHKEEISTSPEVQVLKTQASDIVKNHNEITAISDSYVDTQENSPCDDCSEAAVLSAASHHIAGKYDKAQVYAEKAFRLSPNGKIPFLLNSNLISTDGDIENQVKVAKAKDFIIRSNNQGTEDFKNGNVNFLGLAKYKEAVSSYQNALQKGLSDNKIREDCYIYLAICLYHTNRFTEAENLILHAFQNNPNLVIQAGEQATRDALQNYINNYKGNM